MLFYVGTELQSARRLNSDGDTAVDKKEEGGSVFVYWLVDLYKYNRNRPFWQSIASKNR